MEANVCEVILDFLNVAIHQILFLRDIYPEEVFASAKQYGVPVKMSRHPELNQYIAESLILTRDWIMKVNNSLNSSNQKRNSKKFTKK